MLKAAIFDMDGVLLDSHPAHMQAWRMFLKEIGHDCPDTELDFILDGRTRQDILSHFLGNLSEQEIGVYSSIKDEYFRACAEQVHTIPGVRLFLDQLIEAGLRIAVASSASRMRVQEMLERFELSNYFSAVITGTDVRHGKPDPAIYELATSRLGYDPQLMIAFEDAASGVKAATAAGLKCVGICDEQHSRKLLLSGAIKTYPDFTEIFLPEIQSLLDVTAQSTI